MGDTAIAATAGCSLLAGAGVAVIHQIGGGNQAADTVRELGMPWPAGPLELVGDDRCRLAWRSPTETVVIARDPASLRPLLTVLEPGRDGLAFALEVSEAMAVVELTGVRLDEWLARLVDASAIPRDPGSASPARFADVSVHLLRLGADRAWLLAERPLLPYVQDWLEYARDGLGP